VPYFAHNLRMTKIEILLLVTFLLQTGENYEHRSATPFPARTWA